LAAPKCITLATPRPLEHDARRHRLRQADRLDRHVTRGPRHRPADFFGRAYLVRCRALPRAQGTRVVRRHESAELASQPRERNKEQGKAGNQQTSHRLGQKQPAAIVDLRESRQPAAERVRSCHPRTLVGEE